LDVQSVLFNRWFPSLSYKLLYKPHKLQIYPAVKQIMCQLCTEAHFAHGIPKLTRPYLNVAMHGDLLHLGNRRNWRIFGSVWKCCMPDISWLPSAFIDDFPSYKAPLSSGSGFPAGHISGHRRGNTTTNDQNQKSRRPEKTRLHKHRVWQIWEDWCLKENYDCELVWLIMT